MNKEMIQRLYRVTMLNTLAAIVFYLFFQVNKGGPFRDINPFGEDPYDAVGSFAVQGALLIGILTYARALRLHVDPVQATKARLILRGNLLVLGAILVTLIADAIAEIVHPLPMPFWGKVLLVELVVMFVLVTIGAIALGLTFRSVQTVPPPHDLTPADGLDDLWTLVRIPAQKASAILPHEFLEWVLQLNSDWLFSRVQWLNPRVYPWRFAICLGLLVGVGLTLAQLQEGFPPSLKIGLIVAGIFISGEFAATLAGFAVFGGFLGLRPPLHKTTR